jgi:hypothetical protein
VPGRYSGPPKKMPSWLQDGNRNLKIPKIKMNSLGVLVPDNMDSVEFYTNVNNMDKKNTGPLSFLNM